MSDIIINIMVEMMRNMADKVTQQLGVSPEKQANAVLPIESVPQDKNTFELLSKHYSNQLIKYFESIPVQKTVIFEPTLSSFASFLMRSIPASAKISETGLLTDKGALSIKNQTVVFVVRPERRIMEQIIYQIRSWKDLKEHWFLFIPRTTIECENMLFAEKLYNPERITQMQIDLLPLEEDLLSLEMPTSFQHYMLGTDDSYKIYVQDSIQRIEQIFGTIKYKFAKGDDSCQILDRIQKSRTGQDNQDSIAGQDSEIDALILIDRGIDLISPFCVNQTYEGLLDEFFGIQSASITVDQSIIKQETGEGPVTGVKRVILTNEDAVFLEVRNNHFQTLEGIFTNRLREIKELIDKKDKTNSLQELQDFIEKLKKMKLAQYKELLTNHINLAFFINKETKSLDYQHCYGLEQKIILGEDLKSIVNVLEVKMMKQYDRDRILRLICLLSVTQSGLKQEMLNDLRKFYIMNYGYQEILTLMSLQDSKLLKVKDKKMDFAKLKRVFRLINEETKIQNPNDISYVHNGYSCLSVKFLEAIMTERGFKRADEKVRLLPGATRYPPNESELFEPIKATSMDANKRKRVMVYFVGGMTYGEVAAVRFLNRVFKGMKFIIATTQMINGNSAIKMLRPDIKNNLDMTSILKKGK